LKITGEQAQKLVFSARKNGALKALNDPTQMPIVENLIAEVLEVNNFLPEGTTFAGFEEIAGPGRDGKSTKVFVPMMEDANGQKTDIGQMLGGEGADAFTAEQIIDFIEGAGQANLGVNTSMALDSVAKAPEANAGEPLTPNLGTNAQGTATQQTSPVVNQTETETQSLANSNPVVDDPASGASDPSAVANPVEAPLTNQQRVDELVLEAAAKYSDQASNLDPDIQKQLEDILLDDVMSMTGANINDAQQMIIESRRNSGEVGEVGGLLTAKQAGANTVKAAGMVGDTLADVGNVLGYLPNKIINGVKDFAVGFGEELNNDGSTPTVTSLASSNVKQLKPNASLNEKSAVKQEQVVKDKPPTVEEQTEIQANNIASTQVQQKAGKKRPTQAQRDERALDLAIRTASGETITAKQRESYMNTGFLEGTKVANVTIGYNDYEQHINQYGVVSYKKMGLSGAAITAINDANTATTKAQMQAVDDFYTNSAAAAMSAAGVKVVDEGGKKSTQIGDYMNQADFHLTSRKFIESHASTLFPILGFNPVLGPQDLGQERLLTGVMTAYAKAVASSPSGKINYSNANSFSAFLKAHSAESGNYLMNIKGKDRLINIDTAIDDQIKLEAAQGKPLRSGDELAQLRAELITEFKKAQGI
jgi:hypothetical protein